MFFFAVSGYGRRTTTSNCKGQLPRHLPPWPGVGSGQTGRGATSERAWEIHAELVCKGLNETRGPTDR